MGLVSVFVLILIVIFLLNRFSQNRIRSDVQEITIAEGKTIRDLLAVAGRFLTVSSEGPFHELLTDMYRNPSIVYVGLFKDKTLQFLLSRYDGYFPVSRLKREVQVFSSPIGKIFDIESRFKSGKHHYRLHIGFHYRFLTTFDQTISRNYIVIALFFVLIMVVLIFIVYYFNRKFFRNELELKLQREDKNHFQELSLLTSEIAHEIKNPLNSIYLSFNAIEKYLDVDKNAQFYREAIKGEITRINEIIESYSVLSKKKRIKPKRINIRKFLDRFSFINREILKKSGARLKLHTDLSDFVSDPESLIQVLLNLLNNALESGATQIRIEASRKDDSLQILFHDDGDGIDDSIRGKIFKPYISTKTKGMGLGLHITLKLLGGIGGNIELLSWKKGAKLFKIVIREFRND